MTVSARCMRRLIQAAMQRVEVVVGEHFPEALDPLKAALAVVAIGVLADNTQPVSVIYVGRSGAGKSMALSFLLPESEDDALSEIIYRSDKVTAAAFVSHRADRGKKELAEIDLLPRIKDKTMVTKELAPLFAGKRDELQGRFATLTSVLDGMGFVGDSGAQGRRGYSAPVNFRWLGATTPLSPEVVAVMAQLGPRLLFYDADRPRKTIDELAEHLSRNGDDERHGICRETVRNFSLVFHALSPPGSVRRGDVHIVEGYRRLLALWADVLTRLRVTVPPADDDEVTITVEHAERVLGMLECIAIGSVLIHGRAAIEDYDLAQVGHIAMSSGVAGRQRVFRALLRLKGRSSTPHMEAFAGISTPTTLKYMRELDAVGLATFTEGSPAIVELREPYTNLIDAPRRKAKRGGREQAPIPSDDGGTLSQTG